ncbi:MAG: hypothetical protein ACLQGP_30680 [Isosphaeraceae bacterium]
MKPRAGRPKSKRQGAADAGRTEVVLLIHGTFATAPDDEGPRWWQRGESTFWDWLKERLGGVAEVQPGGRLFRWSGDNSERERRGAGRALLDRLNALEDARIAYHLIAHSHGGSEAVKKSG